MKDNGQVNPDVYAIGDAAMIKGEPLPATAQGSPPQLLRDTILTTFPDRTSRESKGKIRYEEAEHFGQRQAEP